MTRRDDDMARDEPGRTPFKGNFERYHRWFMVGAGRWTPMHKTRWPVILMTDNWARQHDIEHTLEDGWHRLNAYYAQGVQIVPAMWIIGFARQPV